MRTCSWRIAVLLVLVVLVGTVTRGEEDLDAPPIRYRDRTPDNGITRLQSRLDTGDVRLTHHPEHGYLPAVLRALEVPVESQMLVFSKTSLQVRYINVQTPRAIYFNDEVYIGYCRAGEVLEISAVDPQLGTVFYTLDQQPLAAPRFERRIDNCVMCHSSRSTGNVPGHLVRSLMIDADGQPIFSAGGRTVDHTTPLAQRWGGWYVTGKHGAQSHLGNLVIRTREVPEPIDNAAGQNVVSLEDRLRVDRYLSPHSDLVALMVLEHQTFVHNRLTQANFVAQQVLAQAAHAQTPNNQTPSIERPDLMRQIQQAGDALVDALLLVDEAPLTSPISGTSDYARLFTARGKRDRHGRSLRELDLTCRLFKYPCSHIIHSEAFEGLPGVMRDYVWKRLWQVLAEGDAAAKYAHLSPQDRRAIVEIVQDTSSNLPASWRRGAGP